MKDARSLGEILAEFNAVANEAMAECRRRLASLPPADVDLDALMAELAEAEADKDAHFVRFDVLAARGHDHGDCAKNGGAICECCADWNRVYHRSQAAMANVIKYALALRAKREAA